MPCTVSLLGLLAGTYVECAELSIGVLVADAFLEGAHCLLRRNGLGPDDIGNLEVESYVFPVSHRITMRQ